jgi:hypothetical protein
LDGKELQLVATLVGRPLTDAEVAVGIKPITGDPNSRLDFSYVVKLIAGKVIFEDTARYDGTTPN